MLIQVAAATARTIFFNRDRFVWNDWSSTSLTTFTLSKSDMLMVSGFQAASRTKGKHKRFLSYNGFCKVPRKLHELHCLILLDTLLDILLEIASGRKKWKKYDPSGRSPTHSIIQHACDICHVGMLRTGTCPNPMSRLHSKSTSDLRR